MVVGINMEVCGYDDFGDDLGKNRRIEVCGYDLFSEMPDL